MGESDQHRPSHTKERLADRWHKRAARHLAFLGRGLSDRTIKALVAHGIELPEQLLFMRRSELRMIPRIGDAALADIESYQLRVSHIVRRQNRS